MDWKLLSCFILLSQFFLGLQASKCTDLCNLEFIVSPTTEICATDYKTYKAPLSAIVGLPPPWSCYRQCGLEVLYPGECGCPNKCGSQTSRGACVNSTCVCAEGWGGNDCNSISCPNTCSGNGKCKSPRKHLDICECDDGFTGPDCSIPTLSLPVLPYGQISPNNEEYYQNDKYEDQHPIFNLSVIANWNMEVDQDAFDALLQPANTWNHSRLDAKMYFSNGNINQKIKGGGIKLKGHFARLGVKKSFSVRVKDFYNIHTLVLKASSLDGSYLKNQMTVEYLRSMMVPAARGSYATLTINGIFMGLYWMKEEIDNKFIKSRIGNDDGNFYAMSHYLDYVGDNPESYKNCSDNKIGAFPCYKEEFGDGTWLDLVDFAKFLNQTSDADFTTQIQQKLNVDNFLRTMVVVSAINDIDSFTVNGNNWALYNNPEKNRFEFISKDFEETMINPISNANTSVSLNSRAVLAKRVMAIPEFEEKFKSYYSEFLSQAFNPKLMNSTISRIRSLEPFLYPIIQNDVFIHITYGIPVTDTTWKLATKELQLFLETRYLYLKSKF